VLAAVVFALAALGLAQPQAPGIGGPGKALGIDQKLNAQVPLDLPFVDENGKKVRLGDYFNQGKPVVLIPVFYKCQGVCIIELEGVLKAFRGMRRDRLGRDFMAICISIHPKETPEDARRKKNEIIEFYNQGGAEQGWRFLVGSQESITAITQAVGFRYTYDAEKDIINHPAGIMILTPEGRISQYFIDTQFVPSLMLTALDRAKAEKVGSRTEPVWFGCLQRDPATGQLTVNVMRTMQVLGILTVIGLFGGIAVMSLRERARKARAGGVP
jgi:protein SCO1/2